ncbi:MAG: hypothetical protein AAF736_17685, partial [Pseudomonadota bacterium]
MSIFLPPRCGAALAVLLSILAALLPAHAQTNISLDESVSDSLAAGEEQLYLLENMPTGQRVYVDRTAASNQNQLNWILADRFGRVISQDLTALNDLGTVALMGGDYTLTVRGEFPASAGTFTFTVRDVADAEASISLDVATGGNISGVGATQAFAIPLPQGGPVRFFFSGTNPNQLSYRLTDALGNLRQDWTTSAPVASQRWHLLSGTNRIEVRGRNGFTGPFDLRVSPEEEAAAVALPLGGTVPYDSLDLSEIEAFSFSLGAATQVSFLFAYTHANGAGEWQLERGDGDIVRDWTDSMSVAAEALALSAGSYTLRIRSRGVTRVQGSVSLLEVVDGDAVLAPDQAATATLDVPGQVQRFLLSSVPSGDYLLDQLDSDNSARMNFEIEDALGRTILSRTTSAADVESIRLGGGDYTLTVSGEGNATGFVDFVLVTKTAVDATVSLGATIIDSISQPGEQRRYAFTALTDREVSIDLLSSTNTAGLNITLVDAVGRRMVSRTTSLPSSRMIFLAAGDYELTVLGEGGATGDYSLELVDVGAAGFTATGTPLALDTLATATIDTSTPQRWQISLASDSEIYFQLLDGINGLTWSVFDGAGEALFDNQRARFAETDNRGPFALKAGDYTIEFNLGSGGPADYEFQAVTVSESEAAISADTTINGVIAGPGSRAAYLFNVAADARYFFELLSGVNNLRWTLTDQAGQPLFSNAQARFRNDSRGAFDLAAGDYRLVFDDTLGGTPALSFVVHTVVDSSDALTLAATPLTVSSALDVPGQVREYELTIAPGVEQLFVEVVSGNSNLDLSLIDPAGRLLLNNARLSIAGTDNRGPLIAPPGDYLLRVSMGLPTTSAFEFVLHPVPAPSESTTALDQSETLSGIGPGGQARYLFSLTNLATSAFFDTEAVGNAQANLLHLDTGWRPFENVNMTSLTQADRGPISLPPGDYVLDINALANVGTPGWQLRSAVAVQGGALTIDQVIDTELPGPGGLLTYSLTPELDGQTLLFDLMTNATDNSWSLIDPVGTAVFGPVNAASFATHDRGPFPLADGEYELIFNNISDDAPSWLFRVADANTTIEVPDGCAACSALDVVF